MREISQKINFEKCSRSIGGDCEPFLKDSIASRISEAKSAMSLHSSQSAIQSLFLNKGPELDGKVRDETPGLGSDRDMIPGRCILFDKSSLQDGTINGVGSILASTNLPVATFIDVKMSAALAANQVLFDCLEGTEGFRIYVHSTTTIRVQWYDSTGTLQTNTFANTSTDPVIDAQNWMRLGFVFSSTASEVYCAINGKIANTYSSASLNTLDLTNIFLASSNGNSDHASCRISDFVIYKREFSAADIRDEFLNRLDVDPDLAWSLRDDYAIADLVGTNHGYYDNAPTQTTDGEVPVRNWDYNRAGYTNNAGDLVPKRIGASLDAQGNALQYSGACPFDAQLEGAACIDLDGVNQYGEITSLGSLISFDSDFSLSLWINLDAATGSSGIIGITNSASDRFLLYDASGSLRVTTFDGTNKFAKSGTLGTGSWKQIKVAWQNSTNTLKLWIDDSEQVGAAGDGGSSVVGESIGCNSTGSSLWCMDGKIAGLEIWDSYISDPTNFSNPTKTIPISESSGATSYGGKTGDLDTIVWQNAPTWSTQNIYFWNQKYGATLSGSVYVPALLDGSTDAQGNSIGLPSGNYLNDTGETLNRVPVTDSQLANYAAQGASFNGTTSKIDLESDSTVSESNDFEVLVDVRSPTTAGVKVVTQLTSGLNDRVAINWENNDIRFGVYNGEWSDGYGLTNDPAALVVDTWYAIRGVYENSSHDFDLYLDDVLQSPAVVNTPTTSSTAGYYLGALSTGSSSFFDGKMRYFQVKNGSGTLVRDIPLLLNSLDLEGTAHGSDVDITYDVLDLVTNWSFGDTATQPLSVNQSIANQEKEFITFASGI